MRLAIAISTFIIAFIGLIMKGGAQLGVLEHPPPDSPPCD